MNIHGNRLIIKESGPGTFVMFLKKDILDQQVEFLRENRDVVIGLNISTTRGDCWDGFDFSEMEDVLQRVRIQHPFEGMQQFEKFTNLKSLSFSDYDVDFDLIHLTNLESLGFPSCCNLKNYFALRKLRRLYVLGKVKGISDGQDFLGLKHFPKLERFSAVRPGATSLSGLEELENLNSVNIAYASKLEDISALGQCEQLIDVNIAYASKLEDISALGQCKGLIEVQLQNCKKIKDWSPLSRLETLEELHILDCKSVPDLSFLKNLIKLRDLFFPGTKVLDNDLSPIKELRKFSNLKTVVFRNSRSYNARMEDFEEDEV